jgi:DNA-directed RNA polymerase delta subunit
MNLKKMTKEELELLSYTKIAELYLQENNKPMNTADLFKEVCNLLELGESDYQKLIADFFQSLTTSKEFILLDNGNWDLKEKHIVKVQLDEDDEEEHDEENESEDDLIELEGIEDEYNSVDNSFEDETEDLSDLTIVGEDELEEE